MTGGRPVSVCLDLSPSHGGMYRGVLDVAAMLDSPVVSFRDGSGALPPDGVTPGLTHIDITRVPILARVFRLPRHVRQEAYRAFEGASVLVVHSLFRAHLMLVHEFSRATGTPYVVVPHGALEPALWKTRRWQRFAWLLAGGRRALLAAAAMVFATEQEREHAAATLGWRPRSAVIPFPVPAAHGRSSIEERNRARTRLGLPAESRVLLVLGRLDPVKRPHEILQAFLEADARTGVLMFAGDDGLLKAADLQARVPRALQSRVRFLGHVDADGRAEAFAASDAYLSWSAHESFGYAAAESMAAALPVILAPSHPMAKEVRMAGCGIVPEAADHLALVGAIRDWAAWSDETLGLAGAAAHRLAASRPGTAEIRERWRALLADLRRS